MERAAKFSAFCSSFLRPSVVFYLRVSAPASDEWEFLRADYFSINMGFIVKQTPFFLLALPIDLLLVFARS
jgi:hypothetical protein